MLWRVAEQLEPRLLLAWSGTLDLGTDFVLASNETVSGNTVVRLSGTLTVNQGVTIQGDADSIPDTLTIIAGGQALIYGEFLFCGIV
jgi:hypothetical protein